MDDVPHYEIRIHQRAEKELASVTGKSSEILLERLRELKYHEEPSSANYVNSLEDHKGLLAVKVDNYRALATLDKPYIKVLLVDTRARVYDRIDVAKERSHLD